MEQTAYAMEIFALSHEFGHHALGHGRVLDPVGAKEEEFEADRYAAKLCEIIEERERYRWLSSINLPNPYLYTGAGGVLLLASLEIFRKVKGRVYQSLPYDTHPDFQSRSAAIKSRLVLQPYKYMTALDFCGSVENVLRCVLLELAPIMEVYPFDEVAKLNLDDWEKMAFR